MSRRSVAYSLWDVFTNEPFRGNPLAVVHDAAGLTSAEMQRVAREFNLSETSFLLPSERLDIRADARARYFTPTQELPMAGHPSIGSVYALHDLGRLDERAAMVTLELGVGPVKMGLERHEGRLERVWMNQGRPTLVTVDVDRAVVATAMGLTLSELEDLPVAVGSAGVEFMIVPVRSLRALASASLDAAGMARLMPRGHQGVLVVTRDVQEDPEAFVRTRMFGAALGIVEDPATGSAAGPLGAYLATHGVLPLEAEASFVNVQGVEMGRRSRIEVNVHRSEGGFDVYVGGAAVKMGEGRLYL